MAESVKTGHISQTALMVLFLEMVSKKGQYTAYDWHWFYPSFDVDRHAAFSSFCMDCGDIFSLPGQELESRMISLVKLLVRVVIGGIALLIFIGFISTLYQVITGNIICCRGDLGRPVGFYLVLVPVTVFTFIFRLFLRRKR